MSDYLRARDALLAVRDIPGGQGLACLLADQIGDLSQHGAMVGSTLQAEMLVKAVGEAWRTERRDEQGRWTDTPRVATLTAAEEHALTTWTGAQSGAIRKGYEDGIPQTDLAKEFDRAIRKLPAESGTFWRGINIDLQARDMPGFVAPEAWDKRLEGLSDEEAQRRWEQETAWPQYWAPADRVTAPEDVAAYWRAKMGHSLIWGAPSSSAPSRDSGVVEKFVLGPGARTVFKVTTSQARDISKHAMARERWENEHAIPPGQFEITAVDVQEYPILDPFDPDYRQGKRAMRPIVTVTVRDITGTRAKAIGGFVLESLKAYDPLQPRQPRGTEHGGEWTRLQHARGPFASRRIATPSLETAPALSGDASTWTPEEQERVYGLRFVRADDPPYKKILAHDPDTGAVIGQVEYRTESTALKPGYGLITFIETAGKRRREGIAHRLYDWMTRNEPQIHEWEWGFTTPAGNRLRHSLPQDLAGTTRPLTVDERRTMLE